MSSRLGGIVALSVGIALIGVAVFFFLESIAYIQIGSQAVVAGLLAAIIGFVTLSAGTAIIRSYLLSRVAEQK